MDYSFADMMLVAGEMSAGIVGAGTAVAYFADPEPPVSVGQRGALVILGTTRTFTVTDVGSEGGYAYARLVAGAGKLSEQLSPRDYRGYVAGDIAADCLKDAGEVVGSGWRNLSQSCEHWTRALGACKDAIHRLARLTDDPDLHWRVVGDGSVALVRETWPANRTVVSEDSFPYPQDRMSQFWPADGSASPGQSVEVFGVARRARRVQYRWTTEEVTCRLWY